MQPLRSASEPVSPSSDVKQIRVYVIEHQLLMAKALATILQQDGSILVVGDASDASAAALTPAAPDLILVDSDPTVGRLSEIISTCRLACPAARIGVLSSHLNAEAMQRVLSAGADGYIVKDITPEALVAAVKTMAGGNLYVDPRLVGLILRKHAGIAGRDPNELSAREIDVVRLIACGMSNKDISERLIISSKTIKNHVSRIFAKLNVNARTQVVLYAMRTGLA